MTHTITNPFRQNLDTTLFEGGFYKFISDDFEICFEQIAVQKEGA